MNLKMFWWKIVAAFTPPPRPMSKKDLEIRRREATKDIIIRILLR